MEYNVSMRKIRTLLVLGFLVSIMPYLGFPYFMKNILISVFGLTIIYLSYLLYSQNKRIENKKVAYENFSENHDFVENTHQEDTEANSITQ
jgi:Ca2+/Na+ antiporter